MRSTALFLLLLLLLPTSVLAAAGSLTDGIKPKEGSTLTDFTLPYPDNAAHVQYLGLPEGERSFTLSQIDADAVLIEIFSMYCPFCQREAPVVNKMFDKLRSSDLDGRLKMIGIGTGNSEYEVGIFRDKYDVKMPLFADEKFEVYDGIGQVGTPFFILLRKAPDGDGLSVMRVHEGVLNDPDAFFNEVLDRVENIQPAQ